MVFKCVVVKQIYLLRLPSLKHTHKDNDGGEATFGGRSTNASQGDLHTGRAEHENTRHVGSQAVA